MNLYEGMFLFEAREKAEWEPLRDHALGILEKHGANVLRHEKWAERKLAYEIKKARRGIYFLTYFEANGDAVDTIRRDCSISEKVLRVLIIRRDALPEDADARQEAKDATVKDATAEKAPDSRPPAKQAADSPAESPEGSPQEGASTEASEKTGPQEPGEAPGPEPGSAPASNEAPGGEADETEPESSRE